MQTTSDLLSALHDLQQHLPTVAKANTADTGKYKYKYADLIDVQAAIFPLLDKYNLTWTTAPTLTPQGFALHYALRHVSGEAIEGDYYLPSGTPQEIGSAITYARRYAALARELAGKETDAARKVDLLEIATYVYCADQATTRKKSPRKKSPRKKTAARTRGEG